MGWFDDALDSIFSPVMETLEDIAPYAVSAISAGAGGAFSGLGEAGAAAGSDALMTGGEFDSMGMGGLAQDGAVGYGMGDAYLPSTLGVDGSAATSGLSGMEGYDTSSAFTNSPGYSGQSGIDPSFSQPGGNSDLYGVGSEQATTQPLQGGYTAPDTNMGTQGAYNNPNDPSTSGVGSGSTESPFSLTKLYNQGQDFLNKPLWEGGPSIAGGAKGANNVRQGMSLLDMASSASDYRNKMGIADAQRNFQNTQMDRVNNYGAPGSPEATMMQQELDRRDAKAGRNSQYGQRASELQAKLANTRANFASQTLGTGFKNTTDAANNQYGALNSAFFNMGNRNRVPTSGTTT